MSRTVLFVVALLAAIVLAVPVGAEARGRSNARANAVSETVSYDQLPREAQSTVTAIRAGGPFKYARKDGSVFGNREQRLPPQARGYYREYTVPTPGAGDRGARRVIAGAGATGDVKTSGEYWYTDDHYAHFRRIVGFP